MANSFNVQGNVTLSTTRAEKDLSRFINKAEKRKVKLALDDRAFTQPLGRITGAADEFNKSLAASNARVIAFAASAGLMYSVQRALTEVAKSAIEVEKSLADVNVILGASTANLQKFGNQLFRIAGQTGQAFGTVSEAATELARQGLSLEETLKRTRDAMILTRLSGMDAASSVNALTAAMNTFKNTALDTTKIVNKLANVDAAFAVSTTDLAEALKRVGSSALDAGVNFDQLLAMVTAVQQTTARGGPVIGNALKSIFTRIQRTETLDQLERLGFAVRSLDGTTRPAIAILSELSKKIDTLTAAQKASTTELIGGVFQINVVKAALADLGSQYSIYNNALDVSVASTNQAIQRNEELNKTLAALVNKTFANVKKAAADIGKLTIAPALGGMLGKVNELLEDFDVSKPEGAGEKIAAGILDGMGKFIKGPGLVIGLAIIGRLLQNFGKFASDSFKEFFNLNEAAKKRVELEKFVNAELMKNEDLTQAILKGELSVADAEKVILANLKSRVVEQERILKIVQQTSSLLKGSGVRVVGTDIGGETAYSVKPPKTKSGGHIPNYANGNVQDLIREELKGASYATGGTKAVIDTLPGLGLHVRNTSETVKNSPIGPFINPPMNSPEGYRHRSEAIKRTGMDPYTLSGGYVPNFAPKATTKGRPKGGKSINLGNIGQDTGMLIPERGATQKNQTFTSSVSGLKLGKKREALFRKKYPEATSVQGSGFSVGRIQNRKNVNMDNAIDGAMTDAFPKIAKSLFGGRRIPGGKGLKFSQYFDKKGWPQTRGRIFEGVLNFVQAKTENLTGESGGQTFDFPQIQDRLAGLYGVPVNTKQDAKNSFSGDAQSSMINKALSGIFSQGFIPNFATANLTGVKSGLEKQIQSVAAGDIEINKTQGIAARIQSSPLSAPEKTELKNKLDRAKDAQRARKSPKGVTIDGNNLGSMLVPKVGNSGGVGVAKPEASDNEFLRRYLSKHYQAKTGVDFNSLSEAQQNKVMGGTKATFPVLAPLKGGKRNIVDEVRNAMENETQAFAASMIQKGGDLGLVQKNLGTHESSISSAAGAVFESGIKTAFDLDVGKTNDRFDAVTSPGLKQAFAINTPFGEFKINDDSALRQNMASKVLKQKLDTGVAFGGHIPNFADPNRMREAMQGGVPYSQTYRSFVDTPKYTGPVIGNTRDEPTRQALKRAVMMHNDPKNAGKFNDGWIPNFAEPPNVRPLNFSNLADDAAGLEQAMNMAENAFNEQSKFLTKLSLPTKTLTEELKHAKNVYASTNKRLKAGVNSTTNTVAQYNEGLKSGINNLDRLKAGQLKNTREIEEATAAQAAVNKIMRTRAVSEEKAKEIISSSRANSARLGKVQEMHASALQEFNKSIYNQRTQSDKTILAARKQEGAREKLKQGIEKVNAEYARELAAGKNANKARKKHAKALEEVAAEFGISKRNIKRLNKRINETANQMGIGVQGGNLAAARATGATAERITALGVDRGGMFGNMFNPNIGIANRALASGTLDGRQISPEQRKALESSLGQARQTRNAAISSAGMTASFVAPMLTSTLAQQGVMSQGAADFTGSLAMGAGMGAMFGPAGIAAGAGIGAIMAAPKFVESFNTELEELSKEAEIAQEKLTKVNSSTQEYIKSLTNFNDALLDTSGKFSPEDLLERQNALQASLMAVPDEFLHKFTAAQGNVKEIQKIFGEIQKDLQKQANQTAAAKTMTEIFEKETGGFEFGDNLFTNDTKQGRLLQEEFMGLIEGTLDMSKLAGEAGKENAKELKNAAQGLGKNSDRFFNVLKKLGMGAGTLRVLRRMYGENSENLEILVDDFVDLADKSQDLNKRLNKLSKSQLEYADEVARTSDIQKRMNLVMAESQQMIVNLTKTLSDRFSFIGNLSDTRKQNQRNLALNNFKQRQNVNAPFVDQIAKASEQSALATAQLLVKQNAAFEKLQTGIENTLIKNLGNEIASLTKTVTKTGSVQSQDNQDTNHVLQTQIKQRDKITEILRKSLIFASNNRGDSKAIADEIKNLVSNSGLNELVQQKLTNQVIEAVEKNDQALVKLNEQNQYETRLLEANNKFQEQIAKNTEMLSQLGGIQDFLGGQNNAFNKIEEIFSFRARVDRPGQTQGAGMIRGSIAAGRSDLQVLDLLRNFAKLRPDELPQALRQGAVEALTAYNRDVIQNIRSGLASGGELNPDTDAGLRRVSESLPEMAEKQVSAFLKDRDPVVEGLKEIQGLLLSKQDQQSVFEGALTNTFDGNSGYITRPLEKIQGLLQTQGGVRDVQEKADKVAEIRAEERAVFGNNDAQFEQLQDKTVKALSQFSSPKLLELLNIPTKDAISNLENNTQGIFVLSDTLSRLQTLLARNASITTPNRAGGLGLGPGVTMTSDAAIADFIQKTIRNKDFEGSLGRFGGTGGEDLLNVFQIVKEQSKSIAVRRLLENNPTGKPADRIAMEAELMSDMAGQAVRTLFKNATTSMGVNSSDIKELEKLGPDIKRLILVAFAEAASGTNLTSFNERSQNLGDMGFGGVGRSVGPGEFKPDEDNEIFKLQKNLVTTFRGQQEELKQIGERRKKAEEALESSAKNLTNTFSEASLQFQKSAFEQQKTGQKVQLETLLTGAGLPEEEVKKAMSGNSAKDTLERVRGLDFKNNNTKTKAINIAERLIDSETRLKTATDRLIEVRKLNAERGAAAKPPATPQEEAAAAAAEAAEKAKKAKAAKARFDQGVAGMTYEQLVHESNIHNQMHPGAVVQTPMGTMTADQMRKIYSAEIDRRDSAPDEGKRRRGDLGDFADFFYEDVNYLQDPKNMRHTENRRKVFDKETQDFFKLNEDFETSVRTPLNQQGVVDRFGKLAGRKQNELPESIIQGMRDAQDSARQRFSKGEISKSQKRALKNVEGLLTAEADADRGAISREQLAQVVKGRIAELEADGLTKEAAALFSKFLVNKTTFNSKDVKDLQLSIIESLATTVAPADAEEFSNSVKKLTKNLSKSGLPKANVDSLARTLAGYKAAENNFANGLTTSANLLSAAEKAFNETLEKGASDKRFKKAQRNLIGALFTPQTDREITRGGLTLARQERQNVAIDKKGFNKLRKQSREIFERNQRLVEAGELSPADAQALSAAEARLSALTKDANASSQDFFEAQQNLYNTLKQNRSKFPEKAKESFERLVEAQNTFFNDTSNIQNQIEQAYLNAAPSSRGTTTDFTQTVNDRVANLRGRLNNRELDPQEIADIAQDQSRRQATDLAFKEGRLTGGQLKAQRDQALQDARRRGEDTGDAFLESVAARFTVGDNDLKFAMQDMALELIDSFENNLNSAMFSAVTGAKEVKEAFKDMADAMLDEITRLAIQQTVKSGMAAIGATDLFEAKHGGVVKGFNRGGMVTGGSGYKDDVPAMLQAGEFVIKKRSVDKFGSGLFKAMNGYSRGGKVSLDGLADMGLLQRRTGYMDPQAGLSSQEFTGGKGAGFTLRNAFVYNDNQIPTSGRLEVDSRLSRRALTDSSNPRNQIRMNKEKGLQDYMTQRQQDMDRFKEEFENYLDQKKNNWRQAGITAGLMIGLNSADFMEGSGFKNFTKMFANGGQAKDNIPALLMGGEYVMSRDAVQKYGTSTFSKLNSGQIPRFADGGLVGDSQATNGQSGGSEGLTNNVNITVNVDNNGSVSSDIKSAQTTESVAGSQREQSKELARTIESAVIKVLVDQKKQGGMLS